MKVLGGNLAMIFLMSICTTTNAESSVFRCAPDQFECVANQTCIVRRWRCDGEADCGDGSDEIGCPPEICRTDQFLCKNAKCIQKSWLCDMEDDCKDGFASDEQNCGNITCGPNFFTCKNKKCIVASWICDDNDDCGDNSDEDVQLCKNHKRTCTLSQFICNDGQCISAIWTCDGDNDCRDGSDEADIKCSAKTCGANEYTCRGRTKRCIRSSWRCDGDRDCPEGDDEAGCPSIPPKICTSGMFKCKNKECILSHWRCDGENDCSDGSDELNCHYSNCTSSQFACASGRIKCIDAGKRCDTRRDCSDGSDELRCAPSIPCTSDQFECHGSTSVCISKDRVCDGRIDCPNREDEHLLCYINECLDHNGHCDHLCHDFIIGYNCSCKEGHELHSNGRVCEDINECLEYGKCSQLCQNIKGGYKCLCKPGHMLEPDRRTCRAMGPEPYLIYSSVSSVRKMTMDGSSSDSSIFGMRKGVVGLDFDFKTGTLFWTDTKVKKIHRGNVDGTGSIEDLVSDVRTPDGIAVDWIGRKIYWSDGTLNLIEVAELDGSNRMVLYSERLDDPRAIAVHPFTKYVYWSDWGNNARIERASMDGAASSRQVLVNTNIGWVNGLTIDYNIDRVFWTDAKVKTIESMGLDGSDRKQIASVILQHPFAVTVFGDYLYYTDWSKSARSIRKINKFTGLERRVVKNLWWAHMDIKAFHPTRQPNGTNPCAPNNGGCSHLCLLSAVTQTFTCKCPNGMNMSSNGKTCIGKQFTGQLTAFPTTLPPTQAKTKSNNIGKPTENATVAVPTTQDEPVAAKRKDSNKGPNLTVIILVVIVVFLIIIILIMVVVWMWKKRYSNNNKAANISFKANKSENIYEDFEDNETTKVFDDGGPRCKVEFA